MGKHPFHCNLRNESDNTTEWSSRLLKWYDEHQRDLPWRKTSDPYHIWVSEIILQQTRVVQGLEYYHRFLKAFPSVKALAMAPEDEVLRIWQGLGYYSRARNMQVAAHQIMEKGFFPNTYEGVRKLKGVGDYTAAAICSFAFNLPYAVVDGNVYRVLARFFGEDSPIDTTEGKKRFATLAQSLLPTTRQSDYNQALMDFGAMQCTPSSPRCIMCPLAYGCMAWSLRKVDDLPVKSHKNKQKYRYFTYLIVSSPEGVWLKRRNGNDIWKGLYEFPLLEFEERPSIAEILSHPWTMANLPAGTTISPVTLNLKHVLTHIRIHADAYLLKLTSSMDLRCEGFVFVEKEKINLYAMPKLVERIANKAGLIT